VIEGDEKPDAVPEQDVLDAYEVREELRKEAQSIPEVLRTGFLGRDANRAPNVLLDGADPAPTFQRVREPGWQEKLDAAVKAVEEIVETRAKNGDTPGGSDPDLPPDKH
jgi:hypothetical protein